MSSTTIDVRRSAPERQPARWLANSVKALARLGGWIRNEYRIRRATHELMALDDRALSDIGLTRSYIQYAARYGTRRDSTANLIDGLVPRTHRSAS